MSFQTLVVEDFDGWRKVALNRPDKLNSINASMKQELRGVLESSGKDPSVRALLLTGTGRGFCAGQDLDDRSVSAESSPPDFGKSLRKDYNPLITMLATLPKPVVCAVNGVAAGAGANLALACDFVLAASSASFVQAFCRIGLVPDSGGTWLLPRLVGMARARALAMLGEALDASTAEQWGLIYKCVDDDKLAKESASLAQRLAQAPTAALGQIKQMLIASGSNSLEQQLEVEAQQQAIAGRSKDCAEGVQAFMDRRKPAFKGV